MNRGCGRDVRDRRRGRDHEHHGHRGDGDDDRVHVLRVFGYDPIHENWYEHDVDPLQVLYRVNERARLRKQYQTSHASSC